MSFVPVLTWFIVLLNSEFCSIVRKIYIYTKEEVQKMNSKSSAPRKEEPLASGELCVATNE
jgi:hypothetical protein